ncbi:MAG: DUF5009 domain-containing protein [Bacteroidales bacterium]|jgi:predicted acyltransferase|nr:DUF5009 domain-containing protein [Bacteroidales bacterium]MCI2145867.1 DUF5009 domain-containing protein [Bacteroidales bacterium]
MEANKSNRLESIDALRGFDMFWIMGGEGIVLSLAALSGAGWLQWLGLQMQHEQWAGLHIMDLVFPLFLFIAGTTFPFSLAKRRSKGQKKGQIYKHVFTRAILLFLFGLIYNGLLQFNGEPRIASVLARIGFAWMFGAIIFMNTKKTSVRLLWSFGLLIFYALLFSLVPAPDAPAGTDIFSAEGNIVAWFDRKFLPGSLYGGNYDPEGILGLIPATANALLGMITGDFLMSEGKITPGRKSLYMAICGAVFIAAAFLLNPVVPIIKKLWTPTFVLATVGIGLVLLALFYWIIDVKKWRKWAFPFRVIGLNSITIYLGQAIISFDFIAGFFLNGVASKCPKNVGDLILACGYFLVCWFFLWFLYKKKIFLKV